MLIKRNGTSLKMEKRNCFFEENLYVYDSNAVAFITAYDAGILRRVVRVAKEDCLVQLSSSTKLTLAKISSLRIFIQWMQFGTAKH